MKINQFTTSFYIHGKLIFYWHCAEYSFFNEISIVKLIALLIISVKKSLLPLNVA